MEKDQFTQKMLDTLCKFHLAQELSKAGSTKAYRVAMEQVERSLESVYEALKGRHVITSDIVVEPCSQEDSLSELTSKQL